MIRICAKTQCTPNWYVVKICKYGIFVAKIYKYAFNDSFLRFGGFSANTPWLVTGYERVFASFRDKNAVFTHFRDKNALFTSFRDKNCAFELHDENPVFFFNFVCSG